MRNNCVLCSERSDTSVGDAFEPPLAVSDGSGSGALSPALLLISLLAFSLGSIDVKRKKRVWHILVFLFGNFLV